MQTNLPSLLLWNSLYGYNELSIYGSKPSGP